MTLAYAQAPRPAPPTAPNVPMAPDMPSAAAAFTALFRASLARQVEYSFSDEPDRMTTMIPLAGDEVAAQLVRLAASLPFAGDWSWAVPCLIRAVRPDAFLLRMDWQGQAARAVTLYARFPTEPDDAAFHSAMAAARPFQWHGPPPSALAAALGVPGPRGIALRVGADGSRQAALYFKSEHHVGPSWGARLADLLPACGWDRALAPRIEADLRPLYRPGPLGVVGVDGGEEDARNIRTARIVKFDPANVPLGDALGFLARVGVSPARLAAVRAAALGLRADSASYVGAQYGPGGFAGWRVYLACEPPFVRRPGLPAMDAQRHLRPLRRGPHY